MGLPPPLIGLIVPLKPLMHENPASKEVLTDFSSNRLCLINCLHSQQGDDRENELSGREQVRF
jgi:hypothetical protein